MVQKALILLLILLNFFFIFYQKKISKIINIYDYPDNIRKFQEIPVPLIGGFIFYFNLLFICTLFIFSDYYYINNIFNDYKSFIIFIFFSTVFFIFGIYDDVKKINPNIKLLIAISILLFYCYLNKNIVINSLKFSFVNQEILLNKFSIPFTILCFLLFINAFNMFDGLDLQCSIYSVFILILLFLSSSNILFLFLIIPLLFFLYLNFNKLSYLGNNGSILISFVIAVIIIKLYNNNIFMFSDRIFLIMCIPGFDLLRLAIVRICNKRHPFYPDNNHLHHILYKKFNLLITTLTIQGMIILPNLLFFIGIPSIILIFLSFIFYISVVIFIGADSKNS
jgi:UDP-GlcNAc:undecaprenyl-phosphate GlcNAc-1-phosphate transferase